MRIFIHGAELWKLATALPGGQISSHAARSSAGDGHLQDRQQVLQLRDGPRPDDRRSHRRLVLHPGDGELGSVDSRRRGRQRRTGYRPRPLRDYPFGVDAATQRPPASRRAGCRRRGSGQPAHPWRVATRGAARVRRSRHIGTSSFSTRRSSRLYGGWSVTNATQSLQLGDAARPRSPATPARWSCRRSRTLPWRTRSVSAPSVSSIGDVEVGPVQLVEVDVVGLQATQRVLARPHDVDAASCRGRSARGRSGSGPWWRSPPRHAGRSSRAHVR